jgi:hypothetical protein
MKVKCAMCSYELTVPKGTDIPEDCDVVCGDCGDSIEAYQKEKAEGATLH